MYIKLCNLIVVGDDSAPRFKTSYYIRAVEDADPCDKKER